MGVDGESNQTAVDGADAEINLNIRCSNGNKFSVRATLRSTVLAFKDRLALNCDVPANQQRLMYKRRILKDDQTLDSYGLQADHTIHMVRVSSPEPTTSAPGAGIANTPAKGADPNEGVGLGGPGSGTAPLFPGLGLGGLPGVEEVIHQLAQNPNMMRDMMNTPLVQNVLNNPEIMRGMIMSNPEMREIIDKNSKLTHIFNDPAILRQTLEAARNPDRMCEMMWNVDRAMSNMESFPEGFNMLKRIYESAQKQFLMSRKRARLSVDSTPPVVSDDKLDEKKVAPTLREIGGPSQPTPPQSPIYEPEKPFEPSSPLTHEDRLDMQEMYLSYVGRRLADAEEGQKRNHSFLISLQARLKNIEQLLAATQQRLAEAEQRATNAEQHATTAVAFTMMMIGAFGGAVPPSD